MTIRPHQHALPIVGARTAKASGSAPSPPSDYRPIHISTFDRRCRDFYATPNWVTEALLQRFPFRGSIWEPCCGAGAMSTVLAAHGYQVVSTDIAHCGFGISGFWPAVVSETDAARSSKAMLDFLGHALAVTATMRGQLALLVRQQWIAGKRVAEVMNAAPFAAVLVLTQRIRWFDMGEHRGPSLRLGGFRPCPSAGKSPSAGVRPKSGERCLPVGGPRGCSQERQSLGQPLAGASALVRCRHPCVRRRACRTTAQR